MKNRLRPTVTILIITMGCLGLSGQKSSQDHSYPIIPLNINFWNYWDHYWITWLDDHPVYEAIELTTFDNPENPDYKLIRVFLSEKSGRKLQYYYLNDSADYNRTRANAFLREFNYEISGGHNKPKDLKLSFKDKDDVEIKWTIDFNENETLKQHRKGPTPSIHSVGYILLHHLRTRTASTSQSHVTFDGKDFASNGNDQRKSWYNKDVYSAVVIFGQNKYYVEEKEISNSWGRHFKPSSDNAGLYKSNKIAPHNYIGLKVNDQNSLEYYQQLSFGHAFRYSFEPPLPSYATALDGEVLDFKVSFDDKEVMNGEIRITKDEDELILIWKPMSPEWATWRMFKSILKFNEKGYDLTVYE